MIFVIYVIFTVITLAIYQLIFLKEKNLNFPIGQIYVPMFFIMMQLLKLLLSFGLKNNINVINFCHSTALNIKGVAFCFMILDTIIVKSRGYQILY